MKIKILADNRNEFGELNGANAFSLLVSHNGKKFLFDTGLDDTFIKNANALGENLNDIDYVIISHGHYDHGDGLAFLYDKKVVVGKGIFTERFSKRRNGVSSALSYGKKIKKQHRILTVNKTKKLSEDAIVFKTNYRPYSFENDNYPTYLKDGRDDIVKDEISLAIKTEQGLVIVSGCSHAGICNIVENAKKTCKENRVFAVIGGFHLTNKTERAEKVVLKLKEIGVNNCYTGHCISDECAKIICKHLPNTTILHTKLSFEI